MSRPTRSLALALALIALPAFAAVDAARLAQARALFDQRRNDEAAAAYRALAAEDARRPEPPFHLGVLALRRGAWEEAVRHLERAVELAPDRVEYRLRLGDAYGMSAMKVGLFSKLGFAKKCKACYEKAVELDPQDLSARWSLMEYCRQAPGLAGGSMARAYEQAAAIAAFNPGSGRFARALLLGGEKKYAEAFAPYAGALAAEPPDAELLSQYGQLALATGQHLDEGIQALTKCLALPTAPGLPDAATVHAMIGKLHERKGDQPAARAAYRAALAIAPDFPPAAEALKALH